MICPQCSTQLELTARFCGVCGFRLSPAEAADQAPPPKAPPVKASDTFKEAAIESVPSKVPREKSTPLPSWHPAANAKDPYIGATLNNRFVIEEKLGEGGFGAVYRGKQTLTGRQVAIKLLHPEMTADENVIARFRREGQVLCSLRDAHTITTYDFDQTEDGTLFIAMELLEGRSLHEVFHSEAPIRWERMLWIVSQACSSLHEANGLGIVHRDLKPENIYLEQRPGNPEFVIILDFGIAKVVHGEGGTKQPVPQLTATGQTLGTLEYMSPEQLMGKALDGRSDIYGFGVVAYELMTGRLPFPDAVGPAELISAQLRKIPENPSIANPDGEIPAAVDDLVQKMLQKDKRQRFDDFLDLKRACEAVLGEFGSVEARTKSQSESPPDHRSNLEVKRLDPTPVFSEHPNPVIPEGSSAGGKQQVPAAPTTAAAIAATTSSRQKMLWLLILATVAIGSGVAAFVAFG